MKDSVEGISYEEYLETYGDLTYTNVGVSMLPLLRQGRDLFIVRKKDPVQRCKVGDVILYRRPPNKYILHRIVEVRPDDYVILGDNCINREYGIKDDDILGVMIGFVRDGKEHSISETGYRLYSYTWIHTAAARIAFSKTTQIVKKKLKKLIYVR